MGRFSMPSDKRSKDDQQLTKITRDSSSMAVEQIKGMTSQVPSLYKMYCFGCMSRQWFLAHGCPDAGTCMRRVSVCCPCQGWH